MSVKAAEPQHRYRRLAWQGALARLVGMTIVMTLCTAATAPTAQAPYRDRGLAEGLAGRLLVAAPGLRDPNFAQTVILMLRHDRHGALGIVVNKAIASEPAGRLLRRLGGLEPGTAAGPTVAIHYGGPVEPLQGTFLHSPDYRTTDTEAVTEAVSVTRDFTILLDLLEGKGPSQVFMALGYAGWGPGQLENELRRRSWIIVPSEGDLVFHDEPETVWQRAVDKQGIDL